MKKASVDVSLFASAVRPKLWMALLKSLEGTSVEWEVVFAGNTSYADIPLEVLPYISTGKFRYIETANIKPSQCYEIARRECIGETLIWTADDAEYPNDVVGKAYKYWKSCNNEKLILSIQTKESGYGLPQGQLFDMNMHRFFGYRVNTPLMAPLALIGKNFLDDLGGIDRRYVAGQYENDLVMRAYNEGASVEVFGGKDCFIDIDHLGKSIAIGESKTEKDFLNRPFATGYEKDRQVLEGSWVDNLRPGNLKKDANGKYIRNDSFEPFENKDLLKSSQSNKGIWV